MIYDERQMRPSPLRVIGSDDTQLLWTLSCKIDISLPLIWVFWQS
ncbi:hypothetical protein CWATWH0005_5689 [Crocosphaera watsonii WH 0005]|uniref:Uncharacterized protein n=1 Tax=Crocosphaera watsonii WH 0005 TaxID=423472 RepID=T2IQ30_CROWT|nr:hypothetical protein [Crocosphaera watsonii]CCQ54847.1 hypothetical protein CWATWH0005_5689 [Crocosphaera watsonii WH 0005]